MLGFFGMGMMVERLKHEGSSHSSSDLLKICVKMVASWSAQDFRQADVTQSGPGALIYTVPVESLDYFTYMKIKVWSSSNV